MIPSTTEFHKITVMSATATIHQAHGMTRHGTVSPPTDNLHHAHRMTRHGTVSPPTATTHHAPRMTRHGTVSPPSSSTTISTTRSVLLVERPLAVLLVERLRRRSRYIAQLASSCRRFPSDPRLSHIVPFHVQDDLVRFSDLVYAATLICPRLDPRPACLDDLVDCRRPR